MTEAASLFDNPRFPRASRYPSLWVAQNQMGPNALWLTEWLCEVLDVAPGMRILDLGCGRAMSSIFLAREYGAQVFAADLWIAAADNWTRIEDAGLTDRIVPIEAEAHALPFAEGFFDVIVSIDAYTYFGTDDLYLGYIVRYLRAGGVLAIVVPGLTQELGSAPPPHLLKAQDNGKVFWEPDCWCFHSADWWRRHWQRPGLVEVTLCDMLEDGWRHWARHERAVEASGLGAFPSHAQALEDDRGQTLGFVRAIARRSSHGIARGAAPHVWEPAFRGVCADLMRVRPPGQERKEPKL